MESAKELLATNGSLDEIALLVEASIQKGELGEGGYEAWLLLGKARSMDEREVQALRALREGTRIAQSNGAGAAGMLVSLVLRIHLEVYLSYSRILPSAIRMSHTILRPIIPYVNGYGPNSRT